MFIRSHAFGTGILHFWSWYQRNSDRLDDAATLSEQKAQHTENRNGTHTSTSIEATIPIPYAERNRIEPSALWRTDMVC